MVTGAVLGAAVGTGLALVITLTVVIYRYYVSRKRYDAWDTWDARLATTKRQSAFGSSSAAEYQQSTVKKTSISKKKPNNSMLHLPLTYSQDMLAAAEEAVQPPAVSLTPYAGRKGVGRENSLTLERCDKSSSSWNTEVVETTRRSACGPSMVHRSSLVIVPQHKDTRDLLRCQSIEGTQLERSWLPAGTARSASPLRRRLTACPIPAAPQADVFTTSITGSPETLLPEKPTHCCVSRMDSVLSSMSSDPSTAGSTTSLTTVGTSLSSSSAHTPIGNLQPELYKKETTILLEAVPDCQQRCTAANRRAACGSSIGKLHFKLSYDFDKSDLVVQLIEVRNLVYADWSGIHAGSSGSWYRKDSYINLALVPEVDHKTRHCLLRRQEEMGSLDERFKFPVAYDHIADRVLLLQICEYDRFSRSAVIGELKIDLANYDVSSPVNICGDICKNIKPDEEKAQILVSLSYLPSAERLTVVILKAKNLVIPANRREIDPVVKIYLCMNGKRVKKKKTEIRKATTNPVWNEAHMFTVPAAKLQSCALQIVMLDTSCDRIGGKASQLGSVVLGPEQSRKERQHWQDMAQYVRKSTAMWHALH